MSLTIFLINCLQSMHFPTHLIFPQYAKYVCVSRIAKKAIKPFKYLHTHTKGQTNKYPHPNPHTHSHTRTQTCTDMLHAHMQINAKHSLSSALSTFTWRFSRFGFDLIFRCVTRGFSSHATHCVYLMDFSSASAAEEVQFVRVCLFVFPLYDCVWVLFCWLRSLQFPGLCEVEPKSTPPAPPPPPLHPMQQLLVSCVCHTNNGNTFAAISHLSVYLCVACVCVCVRAAMCMSPIV